MKIGIIGCGSISRGHVSRWLKDVSVQIVGCADTKPVATQAVAEMVEKARGMRCPQFGDYAEMLQATKPEAVGIFTPHTLHFAQAMAALKAGCHVLIEKPIVTATADGNALVAEAKRAQRALGCAYQMRGIPAHKRVKQMLSAGEIGEIRLVTILLTQDWITRVIASHREWRFDPKLSGGGELMDSGSHMIDLMLWLTGLRPASAFAYLDNKDLAVDVISSCAIKFQGGALGTIAISGDAMGWVSTLAISGTQGTVLIRDDGVFLKRKDGEPYATVTVDGIATGDPNTNFTAAVTRGEPLLCPGEEVVRVITLTEALYRSAAEGRPIAV
jgi:predicted dehydrogenase